MKTKLALVRAGAATLVAAALAAGTPARAQDPATVNLTIKNHQFQPAEVTAPAGRRIVLRIRNLDAAPMEFESVTLRVEKVVPGNSEGVVNLRALEPGRYKFFDDFHRQTQGTLVVQ